MLSEKSKVQDNMLREKYIFLFACICTKILDIQEINNNDYLWDWLESRIGGQGYV